MSEQITFTCQQDRCRKNGTDPADFKKIQYRDEILNFAYVLCNEHAEAIAYADNQARTTTNGDA